MYRCLTRKAEVETGYEDHCSEGRVTERQIMVELAQDILCSPREVNKRIAALVKPVVTSLTEIAARCAQVQTHDRKTVETLN